VTKNEFADACRAFALAHIPELERAARERYDVSSSVLRWVCERVGELHPSGDPDDVFVLVNPKRSVEITEREPNVDAFALSDAVAARLGEVPRPDGVEVRMGRIWRVSRFLGRAPFKYTAVEILVEAPGLPARRVFLDAEWKE
jgi:hypothetical protein